MQRYYLYVFFPFLSVVLMIIHQQGMYFNVAMVLPPYLVVRCTESQLSLVMVSGVTVTSSLSFHTEDCYSMGSQYALKLTIAEILGHLLILKLILSFSNLTGINFYNLLLT